MGNTTKYQVLMFAFEVGLDGTLATLTDDVEEAFDVWRFLMSTTKGERVYLRFNRGGVIVQADWSVGDNVALRACRTAVQFQTFLRLARVASPVAA